MGEELLSSVKSEWKIARVGGMTFMKEKCVYRVWCFVTDGMIRAGEWQKNKFNKCIENIEPTRSWIIDINGNTKDVKENWFFIC